MSIILTRTIIVLSDLVNDQDLLLRKYLEKVLSIGITS